MKGASLICALLCATATADCLAYQCSEESLPTGTCSEHANNTVYLQPCDSDQFCNFTTNLCVSTSDGNAWAWPGEPCSHFILCFSGTCKSGYCEGQPVNATCGHNADCSPGLFCRLSQCVPQLESLAGPCQSDFDCVNSAGCSGGVCLDYFSQPAGTAVDGCEDGFMYHNLCESFACYRGKCLPTIHSLSPTPTNCTSEFDCQGRSREGSITFFTACECGLNPYADSFCGLFPGDPDVQNAKLCLKNWLFGEMSRQCNTERRFADYCIQSFWDEPNYSELSVYIYRANFYPKLVGNDDCVQEMMTDFYWDIIYSHDDWGLWLVLPVLVLA